ncbi:LOW QUALITY PROTEIN: lariat debranching enzyme [Menidia menidia]
MKIAVEGCCHGELDTIYETIAHLEQKEGVKVELLLCCGDFQAVRNEADLECMAVPVKYRRMQSFYKYYSGEKKAPILTIFVGGNHEASNHLQELPYGGWVAPNIYYLGYAGVVRYKGIRIGGISGIYKSHDYRRGHHEFPPYTPNTLRSVYHMRNIEVFKLKQVRMPLDVFLSHDWPRGIYFYGNTGGLLRRKSFLRQEVESNTLGNPATEELLGLLQPSFWFSAHLHVKFAAVVQHPPKDNAAPRVTKFLSLDKCLPHRDFLQVVDVPDRPSPTEGLEYDPEWLAILKATDSLQSTSPQPCNPPENNGLHPRWDFSASEAAMLDVVEALGGELRIPDNFSRTAPPYDPGPPHAAARTPSGSANPQTTELCAKLGLSDPYGHGGGVGGGGRDGEEEDGEEEEGDDGGDEPSEYPTDTSGLSSSLNPDEITLEDEWEEEEEEEKGAEPNVRTPARLVLPEPVAHGNGNAHAHASWTCPPPSHSTPTPRDDDPVGERVLKRNSGGGGGVRGGGAVLSPAPKIKRRNQLIYTDDGEDDGEEQG